MLDGIEALIEAGNLDITEADLPFEGGTLLREAGDEGLQRFEFFRHWLEPRELCRNSCQFSEDGLAVVLGRFGRSHGALV